MSLRKPLVVVALALPLLATSVVASGSVSKSHATPRRGGSLVFAMSGPADQMDPNVASADQSGEVDRQIFDSLIAETKRHTFLPWLATSWKISNGGRSYTFVLRHDVTFHDGTKFDAAAVKFNLDRIVDPKTASELAVSLLGPYKDSVVLSRYVIRVDFKTPYAPALASLSEPFLGIQSPAAVAKYGTEIATHPVGTGPFELAKYVPQSEVVLSRNPKYHWPPKGALHTGTAYADQIDFRVVTENATRVGGVQSGEVTLAEGIPAANFIQLHSATNVQLIARAFPGVPFWVAINQQQPPFDDVRARVALREAIDLKAIVQTLFFGVWHQGWGPLSPATPFYDSKVEKSFRYDPAAAGAAFDALGWTRGANGLRQKNGQTLTLNWPVNSSNRDNRLDIANLAADQLKSIGITVNVQPLPFGSVIAQVQKGDYGLAGVDDVQSDASAMDIYFRSDQQPSPAQFGVNWGHVSDPLVDRLLHQGETSLTDAGRRTAYYKLQEYVVKQAFGFGVMQQTALLAASPKLRGLTFDASTTYPVFYGAWLTG